MCEKEKGTRFIPTLSLDACTKEHEKQVAPLLPGSNCFDLGGTADRGICKKELSSIIKKLTMKPELVLCLSLFLFSTSVSVFVSCRTRNQQRDSSFETDATTHLKRQGKALFAWAKAKRVYFFCTTFTFRESQPQVSRSFPVKKWAWQTFCL